MPAYVILMNLTDQGIKDIKNAPARIAESGKALEAAGGKLLGFYTVMGGDEPVFSFINIDKTGVRNVANIYEYSGNLQFPGFFLILYILYDHTFELLLPNDMIDHVIPDKLDLGIIECLFL